MNKTNIWGIIAVVVIIGISVVLKNHNDAINFKNEMHVVDSRTGIELNISKPQAVNPASDWKTYTDSKNGFSFEYPSLLTLKQDGDTISLGHSIDYKHSNPCDFKGDAKPLEKLSDFGVSFKVVDQNLETFVKSSSYPGWDYVSKNPFKLGSMNGFKVSPGVEGCGENIYYLTISSTKTLVIHDNFVSELNSISADTKTYLSLPGIITPNQKEVIFSRILSSIKFTSIDNISTINKTPESTKPSVTVVYPNGGETWVLGKSYPVKWSINQKSNEKTGNLIMIYAVNKDGKESHMWTYNLTPGDNNTTNIPASGASGKVSVGTYKLKIKLYYSIAPLPCIGCTGTSEEIGFDSSDNYFTITN